MSHKSKKVDGKIYLERLTIHDKKSMFRSTEPPTYYLRIIAEVGGNTVIVREFIFNTKKEQTQHYQALRVTFKMDK
jgi:hypothetical protein